MSNNTSSTSLDTSNVENQTFSQKLEKTLRNSTSPEMFKRIFPRDQLDWSSSPLPAYLTSLLGISLALVHGTTPPPIPKVNRIQIDPKMVPKTRQDHMQLMKAEVQRLQAQRPGVPAPLPYLFYGMIFGVSGYILQSGDWNNGASITTGWSLIYTLLNFLPTLRGQVVGPSKTTKLLSYAMAGSCWSNLMIYGNRTWDSYFG